MHLRLHRRYYVHDPRLIEISMCPSGFLITLQCVSPTSSASRNLSYDPSRRCTLSYCTLHSAYTTDTSKLQGVFDVSLPSSESRKESWDEQSRLEMPEVQEEAYLGGCQAPLVRRHSTRKPPTALYQPTTMEPTEYATPSSNDHARSQHRHSLSRPSPSTTYCNSEEATGPGGIIAINFWS